MHGRRVRPPTRPLGSASGGGGLLQGLVGLAPPLPSQQSAAWRGGGGGRLAAVSAGARARLTRRRLVILAVRVPPKMVILLPLQPRGPSGPLGLQWTAVWTVRRGAAAATVCGLPDVNIALGQWKLLRIT